MDIYDLVVVTGVCLLSVGCWLAWAPLGLIVGGVCCIGLGILGAYKKGTGG